MQVLIIILLVCCCQNTFSDEQFYPPGFAWGTATAAYQIEGAYNESGRGMSIWDTFSHAGKCRNNDTGDVADDHYHRLVEDVDLIVNLSLKWYRLSISWSRILPTGRRPINLAGIEHYTHELELLTKAGIIPFVTLYHWDLPQGLDDEGGWLNNNTIDAFVDYASVCFDKFGSYVKHWLTFNEPYVTAWLGYGTGEHAPGRCSNRNKCPAGDSKTEPYIAAHNIILSHAKAVKLYRDNFQTIQQGKIGITLNSDFALPLGRSDSDKLAADRYLQFLLGWFADPVYLGDYPPEMKKVTGFPVFSDDDKQLIKGSQDFFGLNHYTTVYTTDATQPSTPGWQNDSQVYTTYFKNNVPIGEQAGSTWLYVYPPGFRGILNWIKARYSNPPLYVTENGVSVPKESELSLAQALNDTFRINYFKGYLDELYNAITIDGVDVKGYFAWSLMDNFEWADGYSVRFGMHYVDYNNNQKRYVKNSARFYANYIAQHTGVITADSKWWYLVFFVIPGIILLIIVTACKFYEKSRMNDSYDSVTQI